jgi:hypothetical protein
LAAGNILLWAQLHTAEVQQRLPQDVLCMWQQAVSNPLLHSKLCLPAASCYGTAVTTGVFKMCSACGSMRCVTVPVLDTLSACSILLWHQDVLCLWQQVVS